MQNQYYEEALSIRDELVSWRRGLHQMPELGLSLPKTSSFIKARLEEMGIPCEVSKEHSHVTAVLGQGEKCFLLRSDMDALPMKEESGLEFASTNGNMHACGHDIHSTILLGAARILKAHESELKGRVKLLFQAGEEIFHGAETAMEEGILEDPKVDVAFAMHVSGVAPVGVIGSGYNPMAAVYGFRIEIQGKGSHGSTPEKGVSPINAGVHIYLALQELIAREVAASEEAVITIGHFESGKANNVIPETAVMEGTLRTFNPEIREFLIERIREVTVGVANTYRCEAKVVTMSDCPAMVNDPELMDETVACIGENFDQLQVLPVFHAMGSEDFAFFCDKVKSCYLALGAMCGEDYPAYSEHNPKVRHNEDAIPLGAAVYATVATDWLEKH